MWQPGFTGRQPCGPQNICPEATALGAGFTRFFGSVADAPLTAKTSAAAKIHLVIVISPLIFVLRNIPPLIAVWN